MCFLNQIASIDLLAAFMSTIAQAKQPKIGYSIPEFCEATSLGRSTVYELLASKQLPARKCGSRTVIALADAISFIHSLPPAEDARGPAEPARGRTVGAN